jgi:hypothetical protein
MDWDEQKTAGGSQSFDVPFFKDSQLRRTAVA